MHVCAKKDFIFKLLRMSDNVYYVYMAIFVVVGLLPQCKVIYFSLLPTHSTFDIIYCNNDTWI